MKVWVNGQGKATHVMTGRRVSKAEVCELISRRTGLAIGDVYLVVEAYGEELATLLERGDRTEIDGVGVVGAWLGGWQDREAVQPRLDLTAKAELRERLAAGVELVERRDVPSAPLKGRAVARKGAGAGSTSARAKNSPKK